MLMHLTRTCFQVQRGLSTSSSLMSKKSKGKKHTNTATSENEHTDSNSPVRLVKSGHVEVHVQATPGAKHNAVLGIEERVRVSVAAPATEGKANKELLLYMAMVCGVKKSQIDLVSGQKSREKVVGVSGRSTEEVMQRIQQAYTDNS